MSMPWYIHTIGRLYSPTVRAGMGDGTWPYAVAEPYSAGSLKAAWWVLTGKAYAFAWPKPGDIERALDLPPYRRQRPSSTQQQSTPPAL